MNGTVKIEKLSKTYKLWNSPGEVLVFALLQNLRRLLSPFAAQLARLCFRQIEKLGTNFKALEDVTLDVVAGECFGIIGKNGSGKSTLLQILTGVMQPSDGSVVVNGRVGALLELGSGFNPEFTGRENVHFVCTLNHVSREESGRLFDSIVQFADIGEFIDQPVMTYSSGMMLRLAFAVQTAVRPDVLIIDEALGVGDLKFRNKCMERIRLLGEAGTTIIVVSHDLGTIQLICHRVMWLDKGKVRSIGDPVEVCQNYFAETEGVLITTETPIGARLPSQQSTGLALFRSFQIAGRPFQSRNSFALGDDIPFGFELEALEDLDEMVFTVSVYQKGGCWLVGQGSREAGVVWPAAKKGQIVSGQWIIRNNCFGPGDYAVALGAYSKDVKVCYGLTDLAVEFQVRSDFPTWGMIVHPSSWVITTNSSSHAETRGMAKV
jgi:ABC-type polysaccharide/polyol phosphate transport system ATPase subunit